MRDENRQKLIDEYNTLDYEHGQVEPPQSWLAGEHFGERTFTGIDPTTGNYVDRGPVDNDGYLTHRPRIVGGTSPFGLFSARGGLNALRTIGRSRVFEVGPYNKLKGLEPGFEAHHVGQKALMAKFIPGYNWRTAPSILVPQLGHTRGTQTLSRVTKGITSARDVLARDLFELRRVFPNIPNGSLKELIQMNKRLYPEAFKK